MFLSIQLHLVSVMLKQESSFRQKLYKLRENLFLKKYNKKNGGYTNWAQLIDDNEVYALVVESSVNVSKIKFEE